LDVVVPDRSREHWFAGSRIVSDDGMAQHKREADEAHKDEIMFLSAE
jgi:hypothetical protein